MPTAPMTSWPDHGHSPPWLTSGRSDVSTLISLRSDNKRPRFLAREFEQIRGFQHNLERRPAVLVSGLHLEVDATGAGFASGLSERQWGWGSDERKKSVFLCR